MNIKLTKTIANILGRAAVDHYVGPKAMEMLRYYGVDYDYLHGENGGADFDEAVRQFAVPPNGLRDVVAEWDGKKPLVLKGPFDSDAYEMQCRILELNYFNLSRVPVKSYWYELNRAILKYLKSSRKVTA